LALFLDARTARAQEASDLTQGLSVTNVTSVLYNVDNRNTRTNSVQSLADDDWGVLHNRLHAQWASAEYRAGVRVDGAWFYTSPSPGGIGLELLELRRGDLEPPFSEADARFFQAKVDEAGADLSSRYLDWIYPAKLYAIRSGAHGSVTVGDYYEQFGRGLTLSVRKRDELQSDTTIRGVKLEGRKKWAGGGLRATALAGVMNPLRLDVASGRYLSVDAAHTPDSLGFLEVGMPGTIATDFVSNPDPTYHPDRIVGAELQLRSELGVLSLGTSRLSRTRPVGTDIVRAARAIQTTSFAFEQSTLPLDTNLYFEAALQSLEGAQVPSSLAPGHALYLSTNTIEGPVVLALEAKHYRRFFPLLANVDVASAPEFSQLQYSAPPTTEAFWVDTEFEGHQTCVTGGRIKFDYRVRRTQTLGVWVGRYRSWAEAGGNERCATRRSAQNDIWDLASSFERRSIGAVHRESLVLGVRLDETARARRDPSGSETHLFYDETYARYDATRGLVGPLALELSGWHRRRLQIQGGPEGAYFQGFHSTGVSLDSMAFAVGAEYDTDPRTPDAYLNAQAQYRFTPEDSVALFVGQRRGGLRCFSGVCRVYPPFEGVRLDLTLRL
jgi:hypothetical protein